MTRTDPSPEFTRTVCVLAGRHSERGARGDRRVVTTRIHAIARRASATLRTQKDDFNGLPAVKVFLKSPRASLPAGTG
jgi:hypothetical protein